MQGSSNFGRKGLNDWKGSIDLAPFLGSFLSCSSPQDTRSQTGFVLEQLQQQAVDLGQAVSWVAGLFQQHMWSWWLP